MPGCLSTSSPASSKSCFLKQVTVSLAGGAAAPRSSPSLPPPPRLRFPSADIAAQGQRGAPGGSDNPWLPQGRLFWESRRAGEPSCPTEKGDARPAWRSHATSSPTPLQLVLDAASQSIVLHHGTQILAGFRLRDPAPGTRSTALVSFPCCRGEAPVSRSSLFWAEFLHFLPKSDEGKYFLLLTLQIPQGYRREQEGAERSGLGTRTPGFPGPC